jgi:hypothetical protein
MFSRLKIPVPYFRFSWLFSKPPHPSPRTWQDKDSSLKRRGHCNIRLLLNKGEASYSKIFQSLTEKRTVAVRYDFWVTV